MLGDTSHFPHRGIAPRALQHILKEVAARPQTLFKVIITYMEIYNDRIYDLLDNLYEPRRLSEHHVDYKILKDVDGRGTHAKGLTEFEVHSEEDALNLLFTGELRRLTASHQLNRKSNRSHSIMTVYIQQQLKVGAPEGPTFSKLNLVDLAGSERLKKTMELEDPLQTYDKTTKRESMHINQSLAFLELCVVSLTKKDGHVPYRSSKLTSLLRDSLEGNASTVMIACIWGVASQLEESMSTLRLAARITKVRNPSEALDPFDHVTMARKHRKLAHINQPRHRKHDGWRHHERDRHPKLLTPEQQAEEQALCERYLMANEHEEDELLSSRSTQEVRAMCRQFKLILRQSSSQTASTASPAGATTQEAFSNQEIHQTVTHTVGVSDPRFGFGVGRAPDNARPATMGRPLKLTQEDAAHAEDTPPAGSPTVIGASPSAGSPTVGTENPFLRPALQSPSNAAFSAPTAKERAYQMFREEVGLTLFRSLCNTKERLRELRHRARELIGTMNNRKREIDMAEEKLRHKQAQREVGSHVGMAIGYEEIDEEEYDCLRCKKEAKKIYRVNYDSLTVTKIEIAAAESEVQELRVQLCHEFEQWFAETRSTGLFSRKVDQLDAGEQFERMEIERVLLKNANALAFTRANKTMRATRTQCAITLKQQYVDKRFPNPR